MKITVWRMLQFSKERTEIRDQFNVIILKRSYYN